jgi:hypothetical protein
LPVTVQFEGDVDRVAVRVAHGLLQKVELLEQYCTSLGWGNRQ